MGTAPVHNNRHDKGAIDEPHVAAAASAKRATECVRRVTACRWLWQASKDDGRVLLVGDEAPVPAQACGGG